MIELRRSRSKDGWTPRLWIVQSRGWAAASTRGWSFPRRSGVDIFFKQLGGHASWTVACSRRCKAAPDWPRLPTPCWAGVSAQTSSRRDMWPSHWLRREHWAADRSEDLDPTGGGGTQRASRRAPGRQGVGRRSCRCTSRFSQAWRLKRALERIREGRVDIVTFASSSTVRSLASLLRGGLDDPEGRDSRKHRAHHLGDSTRIWPDDSEAEDARPRLVEAISEHYREENQPRSPRRNPRATSMAFKPPRLVPTGASGVCEARRRATCG